MSGGSRKTFDLRLPVRPLFYTLDQIATLTALPVPTVRRALFYSGVSVGIPPRDQLHAQNLAPANEPEEWRVEEKELLRWLHYRGYAVLTRW